MSLTVTEDVTSRNLEEKKVDGDFARSMTRIFTIQGTDDPAAAVDAGPQYGDNYEDGSLETYVVNRKYEVIQIAGGSVAGAVRLTCTYGGLDELASAEGEEIEEELSTMAETIHLEKAPYGQSHYPTPATDTIGDLIGVNDDKIDGVDVYVPKGAYKARRTMDELDAGYMSRLLELSGAINDAAWKLWAAGEVLFLGATVSRRNRGKWRLEFSFAIQPEIVQSIATINGTAAFTKPGWDYMWLQKAKVADAGKTKIVHSIERVHVAKVYPEANFGELGLGD